MYAKVRRILKCVVIAKVILVKDQQNYPAVSTLIGFIALHRYLRFGTYVCLKDFTGK